MDEPTLAIRVVLAFSERQSQVSLTLADGVTAREAVLLAQQEGLDVQSVGDALLVPIGVFGERVDDDHRLVDEDRVEIYRPLLQSPMELRRQRAAAQKQR